MPSIPTPRADETILMWRRWRPVSAQVSCRLIKGARDNSNCPPGSSDTEPPSPSLSPIILPFSLIGIALSPMALQSACSIASMPYHHHRQQVEAITVEQKLFMFSANTPLVSRLCTTCNPCDKLVLSVIIALVCLIDTPFCIQAYVTITPAGFSHLEANSANRHKSTGNTRAPKWRRYQPVIYEVQEKLLNNYLGIANAFFQTLKNLLPANQHSCLFMRRSGGKSGTDI